MTPTFFVVDTNVLLVAALAEHARHPARGAATVWLDSFAKNNDATLIVDFESPAGHSAEAYLKPQFLPQISALNPKSRILFEYRRNLFPSNACMQTIAKKVHTQGESVVVYVDYAGAHATLPSSIRSRIDPGDGKFVMAAINFIRHHPMGPRFRPTIVYAEDYADWQACRDELERDYHISFLRLGAT